MGTNTRRKDGRIGDRITFDQTEDRLRVDIRQGIAPGQMALLTAWLVAWFVLEAAVIFFWIQDSSEGNAALGYAIYSAFWAFFAFRIGKVWLWRMRGREVLVIDRKGLSIAMAFGERGLPDFFAHGAYSLPKRIVDNPQQILRTFEKAFWSVGAKRCSSPAASARWCWANSSATATRTPFSRWCNLPSAGSPPAE